MLSRALVALGLLTLSAVAGAQPKQSQPLANEKSAYLRGHAANLVRWQPWGEAAFLKARTEQKPIFLSIGYASCHWCHVMERESFMNADVAAAINRSFVPILVDREEHPEVDATYIAFLQSMTGSAGWPANLILTPALEPIVGNSYMKPEVVTKLATAIAARWATDRKALLESSAQLVQLTQAMAEKPAPGDLEASVLDTVAKEIKSNYDARNGGFGTAPKFPQALTISCLLRHAHRNRDAESRTIALDALRQLANSALNDQLGGGFHRYATDAELRVPHYEKMLYDQALLAIAYTEAWQVTKDAAFQRVARSTLDYTLRELRMPETNAFASAQDSDVGEHEGAYYVWSKAELRKLLGDDAPIAFRYYGIRNDADNALAIAEPQLAEQGKTIREKLLAARARRTLPRRDDKVLTGWNGLMISALARAGAAFDEPRYLDAANAAATFVTTKLYDAKSQKLRRRWAAGEAGIEALPEDYAMLVQGLLDLFESGYDVRWLELATTLQSQQDKLFWDAAANRYTTGSSVPAALRGVAAENELALPAANSLSAMNLLRIAEITDSEPNRTRANAILRGYASRFTSELPALASAALLRFSEPKQIVIAGDPKSDDTRALLRLVHERFLPNRLLVVAAGGDSQKKLAAFMPVVAEMKPIRGRATAFVCEHYVCKLPSSNLTQVIQLLEQ
ncbi:MAG: thioredoxin domain-containing protein [Acidobacteriota bacterium]|nr:thioredoxin domain-containing protein [Acidobacteriota bacterium]